MRLLLVEDERALAEALEEILIINKYSVDVVFDGEEALDYLRSDIAYDGIILDIMLPKVDGITVLKTIRQEKNFTPVILLTAKSEVDDKVLGLDSGANDYLAKPFNTKELLARMRAMTREGKEIADVNLTFGNVTLNCSTYELIGRKDKFVLTNKEYQLMETLLHNVGRYISTEQFMEKIWGCASESEINVVWAHISSVRKKLEKVGANVKIKSSRNLGYTLEVTDE